MKADCGNRDKKCDACIRYSEYTGVIKKEEKPLDRKQRVSIYHMPLDKYCERKRGNKMPGKGSWPRYINSKGNDFGTFGCKEGRGIHHPMVDGRCRYCKKTKEEIEKIHGGDNDTKHSR